MKKILSLSVLSLGIILAGCGGESDSSGGRNTPNGEPIGFFALDTCKVENGTVYIGKPSIRSSRIDGNGNLVENDKLVKGKCKMKTSRLNDGESFSLECLGGDVIDVETFKDADIDSVTRDIASFEKFEYVCITNLY